jgi:isocitrate lyase
MKNLEQNNYSSALQTVRELKAKYGSTWDAISPESAAKWQRKIFKTGLDILSWHFENAQRHRQLS